MSLYRVLVVDDSAFMRKIFCDLIGGDSRFEVIATAANGREAFETVERLRPDVVTMDLEMPEMNGLEAMKMIMRHYPTPVIMLSGISDEGARETIKALQSGAFDFIRKPTGPQSPDILSVGEQLLEKMEIAVLAYRASSAKLQSDVTKVKDVGPVRNKFRLTEPETNPARADAERSMAKTADAANKPNTRQPGAQAEDKASGNKKAAGKPQPLPEPQAEPVTSNRKSKPQPVGTFRHLIVIGTSTGGPKALHEVITALPGNLPAPVLVVQHMPPKFTHSLAQRLDTFSELTVTEASDGQRVGAGAVYIAPGGSHMLLAKDSAGYYIRLTLDPPRSGHRPSVDVMFESCVPYAELQRHSVIMTGMGSDGTKGMKALNDGGAVSAIAEAEESCVVYGMPRSAVEAGAAKTVVPLGEIASVLVEAVTK
jgi:two-component system chemotaxis response regulator CheB